MLAPEGRSARGQGAPSQVVLGGRWRRKDIASTEGEFPDETNDNNAITVVPAPHS